MSDLSEKDRQEAIYRYAELGLKLLEKEYKPSVVIPNEAEIKAELEKIREDLGLSHEQIVDVYAKIVFAPFGIHPPE